MLKLRCYHICEKTRTVLAYSDVLSSCMYSMDILVVFVSCKRNGTRDTNSVKSGNSKRYKALQKAQKVLARNCFKTPPITEKLTQKFVRAINARVT